MRAQLPLLLLLGACGPEACEPSLDDSGTPPGDSELLDSGETGEPDTEPREDTGETGDSEALDTAETGDSGPVETGDTGPEDFGIVEDLPCPDPDVVDDVYLLFPEPGSRVVIQADTVDENGFDYIMNVAYNVQPNPPWDDAGGFFAESDDAFDCSHGWEGACPRLEFEAPEDGVVLFVWSWAWVEERWEECPESGWTPYRVEAWADGEPVALELVEDDIVMVPENP
jgi:hypothetical protein